MGKTTLGSEHIDKLRIADICYNPEHVGFEALVTIHDGSQTFRYPVLVAAPLHAEFRVVARSLTEKAVQSHRSARPGLRLRQRVFTTPALPGHPLVA